VRREQGAIQQWIAHSFKPLLEVFRLDIFL
jgi:hypothetical protein